MTTGLVARILCSRCHGLISVSGWESKPCFKLLQTEITQYQWDFNIIMQLVFIPALQPVLGGICSGHRTVLAISVTGISVTGVQQPERSINCVKTGA